MFGVVESQADFLGNETQPGTLLAEQLTHGALPLEDFFRYATEIGSSLSQAHARGLTHGRLCTWGIVVTPAGAHVLRPAASPGGPVRAPYRSPEQVTGKEPDALSDIFSFGAILYEMASGQRAFSGNGVELNNAIVYGSPPPLSETPTHAAIYRIVAECLEKDRAQRRQRIQNAVIELKLVRQEWKRLPQPAIPPPESAPESSPEPSPATAADAAPSSKPEEKPIRELEPPAFSRRKRKSHRAFWIAVTLLILAIAAAGAFLYWSPQI